MFLHISCSVSPYRGTMQISNSMFQKYTENVIKRPVNVNKKPQIHKYIADYSLNH